jgi:hypothetical protein
VKGNTSLDTNSTQTIATFTGTLLRREHALGQKFVQLVFRENDQDWLCVSSKLAHAKLTIGQNYAIEGVFKQIGDRAYIHEPAISEAKKARRLPLKRLLITSGVFVGVIALGGAAFALHGRPKDLGANNVAVQTPTQPDTTTTSTPTAIADQTAAPAPTTPAPAVTTPKVTPKKPTTTTQTNTTSNSGSTAPAVTTTPVSTTYCDPSTSIDVTYTDVSVVDDGTTQTGDIVDPGNSGVEKMCYDDSAGNNPHLVIVTAMTPGTKAVVVPAS